MLSPQGKLNNVKLISTDNSVLSSQMKKVEESKVAFFGHFGLAHPLISMHILALLLYRPKGMLLYISGKREKAGYECKIHSPTSVHILVKVELSST